MSDFFRLVIFASFIWICLTIISSQIQSTKARSELERINEESTILVGDSHAENLPWDGASFILPGSGLLHTYLVIREITERCEESTTKTFICPIWPGSFSEHQEGRFNGKFQDKWGARIGGRLCHLWTIEDWLNSKSPFFLKTQMLLGKLQLHSGTTLRYGNNCNPETTRPEGLLFDPETYPEGWFANAKYSVMLFHEINDVIKKSNNKVIWVSTPTHKNFTISRESREQYLSLIRNDLCESVYHIDLSFKNTNSAGFIDYHHINCHLAHEVRLSIDSVCHALQLP